MTKELYLKKMKPLRQHLRKNMTEAEAYLWTYIRKKQLGVSFRRQVSIGHYIVDFYCRELSLAIEVDGSVHNKKSVKDRDEFRQGMIEIDQIEFLRFKNEEVLQNIKNVLKTISTKCKSIKDQTPQKDSFLPLRGSAAH